MEIDLDILEDLEKPTLYDINRSFDVLRTEVYNGLVGEEEARMVVFTNFVLGRKPVILKGSRASGKSNLLYLVSQFCDRPLTLANTSEKAHKYLKDMNEKSHLLIPEINKVNDAVVEMLKDFGEGASHIYMFVTPSKETEEVVLKPKPFITSIADENKNVNLLGEELLSRLTVVRTNSSIDQNMRVIEEKFKRHQNPFYKKDIDQTQVSGYIDYVKTLPNINDYRFIYPAGTSMMKAIPPIFTDSRRDTDKYFANTYGITMFHFWDRMKVRIEGNEYVFVTPADMWYNHRIFQNILLESALKCGKVEQAILEILKDKGGERKKSDFEVDAVKGLTVSELHTELQKLAYRPTVDSVRKYADALMDTGYIMRNEEVRPYRYEINPHLERNYENKIDWKEVVESIIDFMTETFPDQADEYIAKYCVGRGLLVKDPFTGEEKKITDVELAPEPVKEEPEPEPEPEIDVDIDFGFDGEEDESDVLQDKLLEYMQGKERTLSQMVMELGTTVEKLQPVLTYLLEMGELYEEKAGLYKKLV